MTPAGKTTGFSKIGNDWFFKACLPSDITITVEETKFHLHKFPLVEKSGKIARICKKSHDITCSATIRGFPAGPGNFLNAVKFCYGMKIDLSPENILVIYCAADYLEMTNEYGDGNLLSRCESFLHKTIFRNWKDCITALRTFDLVVLRADYNLIVDKCVGALCVMVCTDPSLFGWPMMIYGSLQSPGGSILWNGINTGARLRSTVSDWWFEDVSFLDMDLFIKLVHGLQKRGIRLENIAGAIMCYCRRHLPGLSRRWRSGQSRKAGTVSSLSLKPAVVDQLALLENVELLLPEIKGKSFCKFLLHLLRVGFILGAGRKCLDSLERRIGMQLERADLDGLLIPNYSDSNTLYNIECVERIIRRFCSSSSSPSESVIVSASASPSMADTEAMSHPPESFVRVANLVDDYLAEVASDVNLKPEKIRTLAESLPQSSRPFHDGLYRAIDVYFKAHPWLTEMEKEELCNLMDLQKLSIDACHHASQNEALPIKVILRLILFAQMHFRSSLSLPATVLRDQIAPTGERWFTVERENQVLKVDLESLRARVAELEGDLITIKLEMKKVTKLRNTLLLSPRSVCQKIRNKLLPRLSNARSDCSLQSRSDISRHSSSDSTYSPETTSRSFI